LNNNNNKSTICAHNIIQYTFNSIKILMAIGLQNIRIKIGDLRLQYNKKIIQKYKWWFLLLTLLLISDHIYFWPFNQPTSNLLPKNTLTVKYWNIFILYCSYKWRQTHKSVTQYHCKTSTFVARLQNLNYKIFNKICTCLEVSLKYLIFLQSNHIN